MFYIFIIYRGKQKFTEEEIILFGVISKIYIYIYIEGGLEGDTHEPSHYALKKKRVKEKAESFFFLFVFYFCLILFKKKH